MRSRPEMPEAELDIYRQGQIDALKAVLNRSRNGATGRALLLWVYEQLVELQAEQPDT